MMLRSRYSEGPCGHLRDMAFKWANPSAIRPNSQWLEYDEPDIDRAANAMLIRIDALAGISRNQLGFVLSDAAELTN